MAGVVTLKSSSITNRDATPTVLNSAHVGKGGLQEVAGYVQASSSDSAGSKYILCAVPSNARVSSVLFQADALGSGASLSVGVWYPTQIPLGAGLSSSVANTVINTTLFVSALGCSAATAVTDLVTRANIDIDDQEKPLWQMAGLTTDPGIDLDVAVYVAGATATQGYVGAKVRYQD